MPACAGGDAGEDNRLSCFRTIRYQRERMSVPGARRAIDAAWHNSPEESFGLVLAEQIRCLQSEDFREARQAMAEGRAPHWQGVSR
jgi:hypothetical protein